MKAPRVQNNRKCYNGQYVQMTPRYTKKYINSATTTIEKLRRERSMKLIKH